MHNLSQFQKTFSQSASMFFENKTVLLQLIIISIIVTFSRRILCHPIDDPSLIYPDILSSSLLICGCTLKKSEMFIWFVAQVFAYNKQMLQLIFDILHELKRFAVKLTTFVIFASMGTQRFFCCL